MSDTIIRDEASAIKATEIAKQTKSMLSGQAANAVDAYRAAAMAAYTVLVDGGTDTDADNAASAAYIAN